MKSLRETYTPLIKNLQDLNQEIRRRLSSMPSSTEQEMQSLGQWLDEAERQVSSLDNASLMVSHHLRSLRIEFNGKLKADSLKR